MSTRLRVTSASAATSHAPHRVRVSTRPNPSYPDAVLFTFEEDCPYCGKRHTGHGGTGQLGADGSYGTRSIHCSDHTHVVTASGRRARLTRDNTCQEWHPAYVLVPAEGAS
jgi:hypothetical protein